MRRIVPFSLGPSEDLALVAQRFAHRMPRLLRYVLDGLGTPDAQSADLMSYLLFDAAYTRTLVDIGYRDASERIAEIEAFLFDAGALFHGRGPCPRRSPSQASVCLRTDPFERALAHVLERELGHAPERARADPRAARAPRSNGAAPTPYSV